MTMDNKSLVAMIGLFSILVIFITILPVPAEETSPSFAYHVTGCAETEQGKSVRGPLGAERGPTIMVSGSEISYSRAIDHLCCRKALVEYEVVGSEIAISEVWSGQGCKCMCFSEIEAAVAGLPEGTYTVTVYETGTKPGSGEPMGRTIITSKQVTVG